MVACNWLNGPKQFAHALTVFCSIGLPGCAQITVLSDQAPPRSEWKFGVLAVDLAPSDTNSIVSTSGFGIISNPAGTALGYSQARIIRIGNECRVVIAAKEFDAISKDEELLRRLKATSQACAG